MAELPELPADFSYSADHEWVNAPATGLPGKTVRVGITAVASDALGEVVFVEPPEVGAQISAGESCGEVESTKSVSDVNAPVSGTVTLVNELVSANPGLLNSDPYGDGWLFEATVDSAGELMDAAGYAEANHL